MTDKARAWIRYQKALTPDRPSFVSFAPGATHAPHHVSQEWIARWKGKFDKGTPVVEAIGAEARSRFTGRIPKVTVEVK